MHLDEEGLIDWDLPDRAQSGSLSECCWCGLARFRRPRERTERKRARARETRGMGMQKVSSLPLPDQPTCPGRDAQQTAQTAEPNITTALKLMGYGI